MKQFGIEAVVDVRRFPTSKLEHFKKGKLQSNLEREGVSYYYLGNELGGFREGGYENYVETENFKKGLDILEEIGREKRVVIICAERFPWKCHRRFIARELEARGWEIIHILDESRIWERREK